jgi:Galactose oxidase, central domain/Kelch motif
MLKSRLLILILLLIASILLTAVSYRVPPMLQDPVGRVLPTGSLGEPRADHTATLLPDGRVLIAGGMVENGVFLNTMELYDPKTGSFRSAGSMSSKRVGHSATLLPSGKVLLAGGMADRSFEGGLHGITSNSIDIYDPQTGKAIPAGNLITGRQAHEAILLPNGKVLFIGGFDGRHYLDSVEIFDPSTNKLAQAGKLIEPRGGAVAVLLPPSDGKDAGKVLIMGGASGETETNHIVLGSAELFDPNTGSSIKVGDMSMRRYKHAATLLADGRVLITGGSDDRDWGNMYDSAEIYDPATRRFSPTSKMLSKRFKLPHATVLLKNGKVLVAGGSNLVEVFDSTQKEFLPVSGKLSEPSYYGTATLLKDGKALIVGGYGQGSAAHGPLSGRQAFLYEP